MPNSTKILMYFAILALISSGLLFFIKVANKQSPEKKEPFVEQPVPTVPQTKISEYPHKVSTLVGIVRHSGLTVDQKTRMKLYTDYIVEFTPTVVLGTKYSFAYLGAGITADGMSQGTFSEGKCAVVQGAVDAESLDGAGIYNGESSLGGLVLKEFTSAPADLDACKNVISVRSTPPGVEKIQIFGTIKRISRPSPDIAYDYMIESSTAIPGVYDMSGLGKELKSVVVLPKDFDVYKKLETTLGQQVTVSGYLQWGYAESQFFTIEKIY